MSSQSALLRIGEFSQASQVSIKTLRYYDGLGLLRPVHIDSETNYRYYAVNQLVRVHRIMALKSMGLSLEQITILIDEDLTTEQIRGMLRLKQAEIRQQIDAAEQALALVEFRLRMIEAESKFPELDVVIRRLEPMNVLSIFVQSHHTQMAMIQAIKQAIRDGKIKHTGLVIDVFHGETILPLESANPEENQHEIVLSVEDAQDGLYLEDIGEFLLRKEPAVETAATLILTGKDRMANFEKVALLQRWALAHGYKSLGRVRYLHHRSPFHTNNPDEYIFEAQLVIA